MNRVGDEAFDASLVEGDQRVELGSRIECRGHQGRKRRQALLHFAQAHVEVFRQRVRRGCVLAVSSDEELLVGGSRLEGSGRSLERSAD